jgi:hypothetical protein
MRTLLLIALLIPVPMHAQTERGTNPLAGDVERLAAELNPQVVAWWGDFHRNPELGNRDHRDRHLPARPDAGNADTFLITIAGGQPARDCCRRRRLLDGSRF